MPQINGGQALIKALEMEGVEVIFGLPGGAILPVYDPIIDSPIRHILVRHEQGAGHMAEGFAHATGRPGVAMVTSGPAATNIVTPLCDAYMDSIPMVVITGQVGHAVDRHRRVPGVRHRRHHTLGDQAQRPRHRGGRHPASGPRGVPHRHHRSPRAGAARHPEGHRRPEEPAIGAWTGTGRRTRRCRPDCPATSPTTKGHPAQDQGRGRADPPEHPAGDLRRRRHPQGAGRRGAARAGRAVRHPRGHDADGARRVPRRPSAVPRHAGHARQLHRGHVDAELGSAHRARVAASTTASPARSRTSRPTPRSSTSTSIPPSSARSVVPTCRSSATAGS